MVASGSPEAGAGREIDRSVQLSCGEHTDYGLLTLVNQDPHIPALQVAAPQPLHCHVKLHLARPLAWQMQHQLRLDACCQIRRPCVPHQWCTAWHLGWHLTAQYNDMHAHQPCLTHLPSHRAAGTRDFQFCNCTGCPSRWDHCCT